MCSGVLTRVGLWKQAVEVKFLPQLLLDFSCEGFVNLGPRNWLNCMVNKLQRSSYLYFPRPSYSYSSVSPCPGLYKGAGDLDSGPDIYIASSLPTEPSSLPDFFLFINIPII